MDDSDLMEIVPTRAMELKSQNVNEFKAIVFEPLSKKFNSLNISTQNDGNDARNNLNSSESINRKMFKKCDWGEEQSNEDQSKFGRNYQRNNKNVDVEFDMRKARREVINFGVSGFESRNRKKTQIALAIELGARPPKNEYKNYKDLLKEMKLKQQKDTDEERFSKLGKNQTGAASVRCKKRRKHTGTISKNYGVVNPKMQKKRQRN